VTLIDLSGKVALVTGAARDVGREISLGLAGEGASVAVNYKGSEAQANELVAQIEAAGGKARAYQCDVADYAAVCAMVKKV